ncbi:hypothetical protein I79_026128 [Cricetulus griseus]|uniref:Uncharacterized protein n=1 Tax=Cricetulus griseus TaxID=10029 RepID=G3IQ39_CRIGR|nr:hypothetical protein I79_026128 [Cricetulus griseus]
MGVTDCPPSCDRWTLWRDKHQVKNIAAFHSSGRPELPIFPLKCIVEMINF